MNHDNVRRSIIKTLTWRIVASVDTFIIAWIITGNVVAGASIAGIEVVTKIIFYYFHERAWSHVNFGAISHPDSPAFIEKKRRKTDPEYKKA